MAWSEWEPVTNMDLKEVVYHKKYRDTGGGVARIMFNRPQKMNAMTNFGWAEIAETVSEASNDKNIGVVVYTGAGAHFGVGGDMQWEAGGGLQGPGGMALASVPDFDGAIQNCLKPVIAAVRGYCIGGHNHLAYHCDFTIAADNAIFGQNGPRVASPAHGHLVASSAYVMGLKRAKEMWMVCRQYTARQAYEMGLVNAIVPDAKLEEEVDRWCEDLFGLSPTCLQIVKQSFNAVGNEILWTTNKILSLIAPDFFDRPEVKEAHEAFFNKRTPNFWKDAKKGSK
ncbi:MAG: enoyl-CoA hydratase/isomerase family protein [Desulfobacterales bacterium]|jgi:naphthoate synthase/2-ketocyclohexanecarboxyl-CoA hydrolase|nr:enoyl-CoA hydratase/isomerase family protein [Desulfobacterales bacterium]